MINKQELVSIIGKYHLNKLVESVIWEIKDKNLSISFTSPNKEMLGKLEYSPIELPNSSLGIINTSQLNKLIGITSNELKLDLITQKQIPLKLTISDIQYTVNYSLSDTINIPKSGKFTGPEEYNIEAELDVEKINSLIKAKSALDESDTVVICVSVNDVGESLLEFTFGGDVEYSNKVSYFIPNIKTNDVPPMFEIHFNSLVLKEILSSNKDILKGRLFINVDGFMKLEFETKNIKNSYYLVKK